MSRRPPRLPRPDSAAADGPGGRPGQPAPRDRGGPRGAKAPHARPWSALLDPLRAPKGARTETGPRQAAHALQAGISLLALATPAHATDSRLQDPPGPNISAWTQVRYTATIRDHEPDAEPLTHGLSLRRTRITARGDLQYLAYKLTASFSRRDGVADASDAYVEAPLSDALSIQLGQFKAPLLKEELTSAKRLLAADRSLVNKTFTLSRSQGVAVNADLPRRRLSAMLHDGADNAGADFPDSIADIALAARHELLLWGDSLDPFGAATSPRGTAPAGLLGAAVDYEATNQPAPSDNAVTATVDLDAKADGWGATVAGVVRHRWGGDAHRTDWGLIAQAGAYLDDATELFARAEALLADADRANDDLFPAITLGLNRYVLGHALKATADATYYPVATSDSDLVTENTGIGLLESDDPQLVLRLQLQAVF